MENIQTKQKKKKGFTLIELIIVIAILGILALIAIPKFGAAQKDAKINADIASAKTIANTAAAMLANGEEVNNSTVAEKMQGKAMPKVQAIDNQTFTVSADDKGDITVKVGEIIVYPTQTDIYDRSKK